MLTNPRFHRRSNPQGLMNPRKVMMNMKQCERVHVVLNALAERISQASEPAHLHSHVEILSLYKTGRDMLWIGIADDYLPFGAHTLRGAVPLLSFRSVVVILHELGEVDSILKQRISNSLQIHVVAVRGELHAIRQAPRNIPKKLGSKPRISPSNHPTNDNLCLSINGRE